MDGDFPIFGEPDADGRMEVLTESHFHRDREDNVGRGVGYSGYGVPGYRLLKSIFYEIE